MFLVSGHRWPALKLIAPTPITAATTKMKIPAAERQLHGQRLDYLDGLDLHPAPLRSKGFPTTNISSLNNSFFLSQMESCVMSEHQLRFKGPGFDFDAKGWVAILAPIVIVGIIVVVVKLH